MKQVVCLCQNGESGFIKQAEHPKAIIPKSIVSPQSLAYIMNQKYTLAVPLYRQEQEFKRLGFEISRQNLSNWIIKGAALLKPLYTPSQCRYIPDQFLRNFSGYTLPRPWVYSYNTTGCVLYVEVLYTHT